MTDLDRAKVQVELVAATGEASGAIAVATAAKARVVKLARSLVSDGGLTDEEALRKAFPEALEATLQLRKGA